MTIYADPPRKYRSRGKAWSHLWSPDRFALESYAREHGLRRRDTSPVLHYDVTEEELERLPGLTLVTHRELIQIMRKQ
jgi:hypothetical protein